jgi:hypothetical protein
MENVCGIFAVIPQSVVIVRITVYDHVEVVVHKSVADVSTDGASWSYWANRGDKDVVAIQITVNVIFVVVRVFEKDDVIVCQIVEPIL